MTYLGFIVDWVKTDLLQCVCQHSSQLTCVCQWPQPLKILGAQGNTYTIIPQARSQDTSTVNGIQLRHAGSWWQTKSWMLNEFPFSTFSHKTCPHSSSKNIQRKAEILWFLLKWAWISCNMLSCRCCCSWCRRHLEKRWMRGNITEVYAVASGMGRVTRECLLSVSFITSASW